jgi:hypothetical protein
VGGRYRGRGGGLRGWSVVQQSVGSEALLNEQDLARIEKAHVHGLTSAQIIQIFQSRGMRVSEATFRKYVQLGLLPRCRRVGAKGKHRGSRGIYPCATVRRINSIKTLMAQSYTIEEIQRRLAGFKERIDAVESALDELFGSFEREAAKPHFDLTARRNLAREVQTARTVATDLVRRIIHIESEMTMADKTQLEADGLLWGR